jgi:hypothetical protein
VRLLKMLIRRRRTALSKTPHALADGLMLAFQQSAKEIISSSFHEKCR